ncbi:MAG: 2-methylcitrate dehydratase [Rhodospirillaceae bacterium]|nr:MAG: 2-methylcitrate dehydratase [Rhodospirillaceae bacterium]
MTTISETLGEFAAGLRDDAIPSDVRARARALILDAVGIALASNHFDFAEKTLRGLSAFSTDGSAPIIGRKERLPLRDAAVMNGLLIHGLDYDDTHVAGIVHPTASAFPAALAAATLVGASGREMLTAFILGIEASARIGAVAKGGFHQVGFHPTSVAGIFGCTLIAGRLFGLNAKEFAMAQGVALSLASGSMEFLEDGAWTKRLHPGWAASAGLTAAMLAKHGFVGPGQAYEGRFGLYKSHLGPEEKNCDYEIATAGLGKVWELQNVATKPYPACHFTHACIDAAIALRSKPDFRVEDIAHVRALVPKEVITTVCEPLANKQSPANAYEAQFSVPYLTALGFLRERFGLNDLTPDALGDAAILALAKKVAYEADPNSGFPKYYSGELIVTLKDGRQISHREHQNRGCADRPLTTDDIREKFLANATITVSTTQSEAMAASIDAIEDCKRASDLGEALAG